LPESGTWRRQSAAEGSARAASGLSSRLLKNARWVIARRPKADAAIQKFHRLPPLLWIATAASQPRDDDVDFVSSLVVVARRLPDRLR
jgi:hypothetical protein